ncbi:hypothetical protein V6N13_118873 [Hibiscus sabdariffa]
MFISYQQQLQFHTFTDVHVKILPYQESGKARFGCGIGASDALGGLSLGKFLEFSFSNHAAASRVASVTG